MSIRIELHCPITKREAARRKIEGSLSQLLIQGVSNHTLELAEATFAAFQHPSHSIMVQSVALFPKAETAATKLSEMGLSVWTDSAMMSRRANPRNVIALCESPDHLHKVMETLQAEGLVLYVVSKSLPSIQPDAAIAEAALSGYLDSNFAAFYDRYTVLGFYAESHRSVEILGEQTVVLDMFDRVKGRM